MGNDELKRIEKKHPRARYKVEQTGMWHCGECGTPEPCDVVKLTRTLTQTLEFLDDLECSAVFDEWSIDNEPRAAGAYMLHDEVRRTLKEVASE